MEKQFSLEKYLNGGGQKSQKISSKGLLFMNNLVFILEKPLDRTAIRLKYLLTHTIR